MNRKKLIILSILSFLVAAIGLYYASSKMKSSNNQSSQTDMNTDADKPLVPVATKYTDNKYGFEFTLPDSWKEYSVVVERWEGYINQDTAGETMTEEGPEILIRHPQWSEESPRQDIPIMIFTIKQWDDIEQEKFHIGAAPINPTELGRNNRYVFAIPARYNYAFPTGYEEVEKILESSPLRAFDV